MPSMNAPAGSMGAAKPTPAMTFGAQLGGAKPRAAGGGGPSIYGPQALPKPGLGSTAPKAQMPQLPTPTATGQLGGGFSKTNAAPAMPHPLSGVMNSAKPSMPHPLSGVMNKVQPTPVPTPAPTANIDQGPPAGAAASLASRDMTNIDAFPSMSIPAPRTPQIQTPSQTMVPVRTSTNRYQSSAVKNQLIAQNAAKGQVSPFGEVVAGRGVPRGPRAGGLAPGGLMQGVTPAAKPTPAPAAPSPGMLAGNGMLKTNAYVPGGDAGRVGVPASTGPAAFAIKLAKYTSTSNRPQPRIRYARQGTHRQADAGKALTEACH